MEFYLEALDAQERLTEENPPIGIIICRGKNKTIVEYALRTASRPLGVASYSIAPQLPKDYQDDLPSPESIAQRLEQWQQDKEGEDRLLGQAIEEGGSSESVSRDELDKVSYDRSPDAIQTDPA